MIIHTRRGFLVGLASLLAAPAIVRAESLMPISVRKLFDRIGDIKPIVGPIPDGWLECNGQRLSVQGVLMRVLRNDYVPDFRQRAADDRDRGEIVGRYVIYGGEQQVEHKAWLNDVTNGTMGHSEGAPIATIEWQTGLFTQEYGGVT